MAEKTFAAFFSYVHADDEHDNGRLTAIRKWLEEEVSAQTGETFEIFQDRDDIHWGHAWEERINGTLDSSTFLITVVTPRYLRSEYCRREFERFRERESKLGRNDLILPLLYMDTPALSNKVDSVAVAISSRQYADWRSLRFEPWTNPDVTKRLAQLAKIICDAMAREVILRPFIESNNQKTNAIQQESSVIKQSIESEKRKPADVVEPPTMIVDPMPRRGDFTSITEAIAAAEPGTRILIRPGLYKEAVVLEKPLELIGDGQRDDIVIETKEANIIQFRTEFGRVSNLTLRQLGGGDFYGVSISQGRPELEDCDIISQSISCVAIYDGADPRLRRNKIHDGKECGVYIYNNGKGTLEDNDIYNNYYSGVLIATGGEPVLRRNRIHNGKDPGVLVSQGGKGTLEDNDIFANALSGVEVFGENSAPILRRNRIHDGKGVGILVDQNGKGTFTDNEIYNNDGAIEVRNGGYATLLGNRIENNGGYEIYIHKNGGGLFEHNYIKASNKKWVIDHSSNNNVKASNNRDV